MLKRVGCIVAIPILFACPGFEQNAATSTHSRIFPPGEGQVVGFDVQSTSSEPILIRSQNVQAQRYRAGLALHFATIEFTRNASFERPEIEAEDFRVRIYSTGANGLEEIGASDEQKIDANLTATSPQKTIRDVRIELDKVGQQCDSDCVIQLEVPYYRNVQEGAALGGLLKSKVSSGLATSKTIPMQLRLRQGRAETYREASPEEAAAAAVVKACARLISEQEASEVLGESVIFRASSTRDCELAPAHGGEGMSAAWSISVDTAGFEQSSRAPEAIPILTVGERGYKQRGNPKLFILQRGRVLELTVNDARPAEQRQDDQKSRKQLSIARKIAARM